MNIKCKTAKSCKSLPSMDMEGMEGRTVMAEFKVTKKGEGKDAVLIIELPLGEAHESTSGKTIVVGSTHGNMATTATHAGKPIIVGVNAYIRK
jgi:hypothetical protein